ncbi:conserved hypothetical protein [Talaromyces stipitatus ATCC 10500]|uniref:Dolichyl-diphosphooligosaccharide--protein glycosyltransferase subunit 4 n=1 Tax=Talaromyces stipitatus (strain ATCC 10500 / CBS 375.48 / QM 6759 / NRRL 1006) TaxID=441959 RepID=B8MER9_TALSN|nr:uncharacterized protein TSTA_020110 [Talaromyces stipitatus ATCC 10500]EED16952.1 conserved hypothetical protein [Talaromyces stipitatus ATCC 10500]
MISDDDLFRLAIFLGSVAMLLIVLYHFLEVNAKDDSQSPLSTSSTTATDKKIPVGADPVGFSPAAAISARGSFMAVGLI